MSTELTTVKPPAKAEFIVTTTPDKIKRLQTRYEGLRLAGTEYICGKVIVIDADLMLADAEGLAKVKEAAKDAQKHRTKCAEEHKKLKEDSRKEGLRIDEWKNTNTALIIAVEDRFKAMEKAVEDELAAIVERSYDKVQADREKRIEAVGGIPQIIKSTLAPNFVRVAMEPQFLDWLGGIERMNIAFAESERNRLAKEESDRIEAKRVADEKAEADRLQKIKDDEFRAEQKQISEDQEKRQKELDDQAAFIAKEKAKQDQVAADQKAAQDKIDAANKKMADDLEAKRQAEEDEREEAKSAPYSGSGRSWMYDKPTPKRLDPISSLAPFAKFAFGQNTAAHTFHLSFNGELGNTINIQLSREDAVRLSDNLSRILAADAASTMAGD